MFKIHSPHNLKADQIQAVNKLVENIVKKKQKHNILLGATGTGKTFTIANVIKELNIPCLIIAHNKTLAAQLYGEYKGLFKDNCVEYYISYFDFYQPEAYLPSSDLYIDKTSKINDLIKMLRLSTLNGITQHKDIIVIASVASIYGTIDPNEYKNLFLTIKVGEKFPKMQILKRLIEIGYIRNQLSIEKNGCFYSRGDVIEISPSWSNDFNLRIELYGNLVEQIVSFDPLNHNILKTYQQYVIFPADDYLYNIERTKQACIAIKEELKERVNFFTKQAKIIEAERIKNRTNKDLEDLLNFNVCHGIENYGRHLEQRLPGSPPFTLIDFFNLDNWLLVIDESHMTIPQIKGMYNTDISRKSTLVEYGFRLPSCLDNRPLNFEEFQSKIRNVIYLSATPGDFELQKTNNEVVEQIIRPTGLVDPLIEVRSKTKQLEDLLNEIKITLKKKQRVFIITLTIRSAEEVSDFLVKKKIKSVYLHNKIKTLERTDILLKLRKGIYDCVVGINLLREGLDIPEISRLIILDADREGFLRDKRSLIQMIGRAARNIDGKVIMYANKITKSMNAAISETNRRRNIQLAYNKEHKVIPKTIIKPIDESFLTISEQFYGKKISTKNAVIKLNKTEKEKIIKSLRSEMLKAAKKLDFEKAAQIRDMIFEFELNK